MIYPRIKNTFTVVYTGALSTYELNPTEGLLLFSIYGLSKQRGWCYASKEHLASMLNVSEPTIYASVNKLVKKGLLRKLGKSELGTTRLVVTEEIESFIRSVKAELNKKHRLSMTSNRENRDSNLNVLDVRNYQPGTKDS